MRADADPAMGTLTRVLNGEPHPDAERLYERAYGELRAIAAKQRRRERGRSAIETTALVHEAWLKLAECGWDSRAHFFAAAARAMRQVLVDDARRRRVRARHRARAATIIAAPGGSDTLDVLALDQALRDLEALEPRSAAVVSLRFFAGLEMAEVAAALGVSLRTAERDWTHARAWLLTRVGGAEVSDAGSDRRKLAERDRR